MHGFLFHIFELESLRSVALGMGCSHFGDMDIYGFFFKPKLKKDHRNKLTDFNQLFETNCLQRGLLLAVVLNYLAVRGRCYLPGLASTLVLLQPPVLTSTDVFLRYTLHSCSWRLFNYF